nr:hypothetical protein [Tanacetum cinerariifolium]
MGDEPTFSACLNWKLFAFGNIEKIAPACLLTFSFSFPVLKVVPSGLNYDNEIHDKDGCFKDILNLMKMLTYILKVGEGPTTRCISG